MKCHNAPAAGLAREKNAAARAILARLRGSSRLAALVLLLFVMKIGAAAVCIQQEYADLGLGTKALLEVVEKATADTNVGTLTKDAFGGCSHCSCHYAAVAVPEISLSFTVAPHRVAVLLAVAPPGVRSRLALRPPIA